MHACIIRAFGHLEHPSILDSMVPARLTLLERDHLLDVWLLSGPDRVELLPNFVLPVLALHDQIVKDLN